MFKNIIQISTIGIIVLGCFLFKSSVLAQSIPTSINQNSGIELTVSPENPKPNQDISFSISSYSVDIDSAVIRWYINDVMKKEGIGIKFFNTKVGNSGNAFVITVEVSPKNGSFFTKSLSINPAEIILITESNSYVPPLYKGRAQFISQGQAKIIAIPNIVQNGRKIETKNLNFQWKKDGIVLASQSGMGKNTIVVEGSVPIRDISIDLTVSDSSKQTLAKDFVYISVSKPQILFYEKSSLYGVLINKSLIGDYNIGNKEDLKVVAYPYYFNISDVESEDLKYKWSLNGKTVSLAGKKNEIILKPDGKTQGGTALLSLGIENMVRIFQYEKNSFNVTFTK